MQTVKSNPGDVLCACQMEAVFLFAHQNSLTPSEIAAKVGVTEDKVQQRLQIAAKKVGVKRFEDLRERVYELGWLNRFEV